MRRSLYRFIGSLNYIIFEPFWGFTHLELYGFFMRYSKWSYHLIKYTSSSSWLWVITNGYTWTNYKINSRFLQESVSTSWIELTWNHLTGLLAWLDRSDSRLLQNIISPVILTRDTYELCAISWLLGRRQLCNNQCRPRWATILAAISSQLECISEVC